MAKLYELTVESDQPEITNSLALSLKKGLFMPMETKFKTLEANIAILQDSVSTEREKILEETGEKYVRLETELENVKKFLRICSVLSLVSVLGILTTLILLFTWY